MNESVFDAREMALRPKLTDEFFEVLFEAALAIGWGCDFVEVYDFLCLLCQIADREKPSYEDMTQTL